MLFFEDPEKISHITTSRDKWGGGLKGLPPPRVLSFVKRSGSLRFKKIYVFAAFLKKKDIKIPFTFILVNCFV